MINNEDIIVSINARLHPMDNTVPECECRLAIAGNSLYVSEDNYDGTYTDHYVLDLGLIQELKLSSPYADSLGADHNFELLGLGSGPFKNGLIHKLLGPKEDKSPRTGKRSGNPASKYLEIVYSDQNTGRTEQLYFNNIDITLNSFIKKFNELTGRS